MKKPNPLVAGLEQFDRKESVPPAVQAASAATAPAARARSRKDAVQIAAFFPEEVRMQLKILAIEQRRDMQDLLAEALNMVFAKHGKPEIAPRKIAD